MIKKMFPQKKNELISVRVQAQIKDKLKKIAIEKDRPLSWVVNKILEEYFENNGFVLPSDRL